MLKSLVLPALLQLVHSSFNAQSDSNVIVYWGQGPMQGSLSSYCATTSIDIINLAFVNIFPGQGLGGLPGDNFGNACSASTYSTKDGMPTQLLDDCPGLESDINFCQAQGKIIMLSIGGAVPGNGYLMDDEAATGFADFLWGAFGPLTSASAINNTPRPFGSAVVDGFDFDIESDSSLQANGWTTMVSHFKNDLYPQDTSQQWYLSAAPQCVIPDSRLSMAIASAWFDFISVQFFNTPQCSARLGVDQAEGHPEGGFNLDDWLSIQSFNPGAKIFLGLPAAESASNSPSYFLQPYELALLLADDGFSRRSRFGGVMLWDAARAETTLIDGVSYVDAVKKVLVNAASDSPTVPTTSSSPATTETPSSVATTLSATANPSKTLTTTDTPSSVATTLSATAKPSKTSTVTNSLPQSTSGPPLTAPHPQAAPSDAPSTPASMSAACPTQAASSQSPSTPPNTVSSCPGTSIPCPAPGRLICVGRIQYGLCNINECAVPQPLAAGTICVDGEVVAAAFERRQTRRALGNYRDHRLASRSGSALRRDES